MIYKFKAAKAIIRYEDLIFLQLRDNNNSIPYPNRWAFFGGRLFPNENPQTGLIREIKEELAFELENNLPPKNAHRLGYGILLLLSLNCRKIKSSYRIIALAALNL
jgi:8-oxo-dGTP pyrophosphatase MutT (NUDIX family)